MRFGAGQKDKGEERAEPAVEDRRSDVSEGGVRALLPTALGAHESVRNVRRVVDTQANGNDEIGAGDRIDGETPEVYETRHVDQRQHNRHQHLYADKKVEE